jgi:hypothetical protein
MSSPSNPAMKKPEKPRSDAGHVPMSEEFDSPRWSLPPLVPVVIAALVLGLALATYLVSSKKPPTSTGSAVRVVALPLHIESKGSIVPGGLGTLDQDVETRDSVMVNVVLEVKNAIEKPMYLKGIQGKLVTDKGEFTDDAAPASDYERIVQAYPEISIADVKPFQAESSIASKSDQQGLAVFSFPVTRDSWDKRKSLQATINFYDHAPLVIDFSQAASTPEATLQTKVTK